MNALGRFKIWFTGLTKQKKIGIGAIGALVVLTALFFGRGLFTGEFPFFTPSAQYAAVYELVADKVSQHSGIVVNLPKGVDLGTASTTSLVTFTPTLKGSWIPSKISDALVYKPASPLTLGNHYQVSLATVEGVIKKDFIVDEDPRIIDVFPSDKAEAELRSAITLVFNRPMVPLTTLDALDTLSVPVTITPATKGKFKWISTRTLQFIPETSLVGSAHYTVTTGANFISIDGLPVPPSEFHFTTRALRLNYSSTGVQTYRKPITYYFNQPIDLARTTREIKLVKEPTQTAVPFLAQYGTKVIYDADGKEVKTQDMTVLEILPSGSLRGKEHVWDFETAYSATIANVYPVGGDIVLPGPLFSQIRTTPVLQNVTVTSEKTPLAGADLFDSTGTTTISFYEDIDISKSSISVKGLLTVSYGIKCKDAVPGKNAGGYYYGSAPCEKVADHSQIVITFDPRVAFARGDNVPVVFTILINDDGFEVTNEPLTVMLTVYPQLKVLRTRPLAGDTAGSITEMIFCTTVPLKAKNQAEFARDVKADKYMAISRFDSAYKQEDVSYGSNSPCIPGEYVTRIHYGLLPVKEYKIDFALEDVFAAKSNVRVAFTTGQAPNFFLDFKSFQKIYNVTSPQHTKLTYAAQNFPSVGMTICKLSPRDMVNELSSQPSTITNVAPDLTICTSTIKDEVELPAEEWLYHYFQIDLAKYFQDTRGQYRISFTSPGYIDYRGSRLYAQTYMNVTNVAVVGKRVQWYSDHSAQSSASLQNKLSAPGDTRGALYLATGSDSLLPIAGATVFVYSKDGTDAPLVLERRGATDGKGLAEFPLIKNVVGAVVVGSDPADVGIVTSWADTLSSGAWGWARDTQRTYMYTDRPIYRPGQEVFFKGIYRVDFDGFYKAPTAGTIAVRIMSSKGEEVLKQNLPLTAYGTFASSIKLPADAPLGSYYISSDGGGSSFSVAAYVGAAFAAEATSNKDEYIAGETATIDISARYYFGVPLDSGTLSWSLTSQNYYFDRSTDPNFSFGSSWYSCSDCGYGDTYVKSGTATLDEGGLAQVKQELDFDKSQSKIFVFHGTVKDKQGKSVSFQKSFIVHRGEYYLGIKADPSFVAAKTLFMLSAKTVAITGKPIGEGGLSYTVSKVSWQSFKRQEVDGGFYTRSESTVTPVVSDSFRTDGDGNYSKAITLSDPGEYELTAKGTDGKGNEITGTNYLYVYGAGQADVRPTNNATLDLKAEKTDVKVGEKAKLVIQNPYPHAKALITIERGRIFTYDIIDIRDNVYQYSFDVTDEYIPNVYASVVLLSEGSAMKFGNLQFTVNRDQKKLSIDIQTDKTAYLPGEKVMLTVKTTDATGNPVPANVSLAVADLSVLALAGNPKKNPLVFFYDGFPLTVSTEVSTKNLLTETPIPTGTKGGSGGGNDGLANKVRGEFKDTAFWRSDVVTDATGFASLTFTLPDNLTKWQVESVGSTKNSLVGASYKEIVAQKSVMVIPIVPRFVVPGDEFMVGVKLFNQTEEKQSLRISVRSETLKFVGGTALSKSVAAGKTDVVYFSVITPVGMDTGSHLLTISATGDDYTDTVEQVIPITRNTTYESTATANGTTDATSKEYLFLPGNVIPDQGGLTIKTSATLALYLTDALEYLFSYPYGCSEQLASKLRAIAVGKRVVALPNVGTQFVLPQVTFEGRKYTVDDAVEIGLKKMLDNQNIDGGFTYYKGLESNLPLTVTVLQSLIDLKAAGYAVREDALNSAASYSFAKLLSHSESYYRDNLYEFNELISSLAVLGKINPSSSSYTAAVRIVNSLTTTSYLSDRAGSLTLGSLALLSAGSESGISSSLKSRVFSTLQNRVTIDSRGAYVKEKEDSLMWSYYETREKDTAVFLEALVLDRREYSETDNLIRTLIGSRSKDGSWGSTNTSAAVLNALANYLEWKKETSSKFTLDMLLDGKSVVKSTFGPENILKPVQTVLPIGSIEKNKLHGLLFSKENLNNEANKFYYDLSLKYFLPANLIPPRDEGFTVKRSLYALTDTKRATPLTSTKVGDVVRGVATIISPKDRHFVALEDYIPAGFELVDFNLATEDKASLENQNGGETAPTVSPEVTPTFDDSVPLIFENLRPDFTELRDDRLFLFAQHLPAGAYQYEYYVRATTPGTFRYLPAVASEMYYPENFGRNGGSIFEVTR